MYLGETEPAPREEDSPFCLGSMVLMPYTNFLYYSTENFLLSSMLVEIYLLQLIYYSGFLNCWTT